MVLDLLLGGTLNRPVDADFAHRLTERTPPGLAQRARAIQQHRARVLRELVLSRAVDGVLDLATGIPAPGVVNSAHLALADLDPPVPVVYVEPNAQLAGATSRLLRRAGGVAAAAVCADPADATTTWRKVLATTPLNPAWPVVLDCVGLAERIADPDRLWHLFTTWAQTPPAGAVLLLSIPLDPDAGDPMQAALDAGWEPHALATRPNSRRPSATECAVYTWPHGGTTAAAGRS